MKCSIWYWFVPVTEIPAATYHMGLAQETFYCWNVLGGGGGGGRGDKAANK